MPTVQRARQATAMVDSMPADEEMSAPMEMELYESMEMADGSGTDIGGEILGVNSRQRDAPATPKADVDWEDEAVAYEQIDGVPRAMNGLDVSSALSGIERSITGFDDNGPTSAPESKRRFGDIAKSEPRSDTEGIAVDRWAAPDFAMNSPQPATTAPAEPAGEPPADQPAKAPAQQGATRGGRGFPSGIDPAPAIDELSVMLDADSDATNADAQLSSPTMEYDSGVMTVPAGPGSGLANAGSGGAAAGGGGYGGGGFANGSDPLMEGETMQPTDGKGEQTGQQSAQGQAGSMGMRGLGMIAQGQGQPNADDRSGNSSGDSGQPPEMEMLMEQSVEPETAPDVAMFDQFRSGEAAPISGLQARASSETALELSDKIAAVELKSELTERKLAEHFGRDFDKKKLTDESMEKEADAADFIREEDRPDVPVLSKALPSTQWYSRSSGRQIQDLAEKPALVQKGKQSEVSGPRNEWRKEIAGRQVSRESIVRGQASTPESAERSFKGIFESDEEAERLSKWRRISRIGLSEKSAGQEPFSTFSLHVSDVSFKLARTALASGSWPDANRIRIEEFVNAFDYRDPMPNQSEKVACRVEQSIHPFLQQRNLLRLSMRTAAAGRSSQTPLRLTLLLDNSGSMERIDRRQTVRRAFALLASQLQPMDQVTLIRFARQPQLLADKVSGDKAGQLVSMIENLPSQGGTNLEAALALAMEKATEHHTEGAQNRIILFTDGAVNLGDANPESLSRMITSMRNNGIAFDAAGISADGLNDEVLEALTRDGDGRYYLLDSMESVNDGFAQQVAGALRPAAQNVKVQIEFNPKRVGRYLLMGFEKHRLKKEDFRNDKVDAAEMAAAEAGVAVYQFQALPDGEGDVGSVSVRFRDLSSGRMIEHRWPIPYQPDAPRLDDAPPSLQLAGAAAFFAAKLKGQALGEIVDLKSLSRLLADLPKGYQNAKRVGQLREMIRHARQIAGN